MKFLVLAIFGVVVTSAADTQVLIDFADGNVEYIGDLYAELIKEHIGNFVVCPLSVQTVFALINEGAGGNTAKEITDSLHLPEGKDNVRETFLQLSESLQTNDKYTLSTANKIYIANWFKISDQYKQSAVDVFHSEVENIDFGKKQTALENINKWVEDKTHDKIKDILTEDMIHGDTMAVLINALYFQGTWVQQFSNVTKRPFHLNNKEVITTNMMEVSGNFYYDESPELDAKFLELPYEGDEISMTIVLPNDVEGLSALENRIADVLVEPDYTAEKIKVKLPKFKIDTTTPFIPILQALGITDAFSGAADFSGIGENQEHLEISEVVQKAFIEVDETGTTAAAATAILATRSSNRFDKVEFNADHPFLFYLKHRINGVIFIGRYAVPEDSESD